MDATDIAKLPKRQRDVLGFVAIGEDAGQPRSVLKALERKGLIAPYEQLIYGTGSSPIDRIPMMVIRWRVPLPVHRAWAAWCAGQEEEAG